MPLSEPASSLTDLTLGLVALALALRLRGTAAGRRHWTAAFAWTAAAALAGAVYHAAIVDSARWGDPTWAVISGMVVVAVSYILAATVVEVLGRGHARTFWVLRSVSLLAYVVVALAGHGGIEAILLCESVTMVCILGLWALALRRGHPRARSVAVALAACSVAGILRAVPWEDLPLRLDGDAVYHLAQIPGLVLLYAAVRDRAPQEALSQAPPARARHTAATG